jgi:2-dehydro-3-deoxyglucarate aldolase/4-hydroxy-2-oxoheptanedioate aldolase
MISEFRQPAVVQLLANAGFDFVIIDNEHGPFNIETIADLSRAARYVGLTPIVRVPDLAYPYLAQSLDAGAQGIMLPRVFRIEQVRQAAQIVRYPPAGMRGCAFNRGHTDFKAGPLAETMAKLNEETMLIIQVETREAVESIEEIVATPGVDVALIGPTDLSIALGVPGQMDAPQLHAAIEKMIAACQRHDVFPALHINDLTWAAHWAKRGMRLLSSGSEAGFLVRGGQAVTSAIREAFK